MRIRTALNSNTMLGYSLIRRISILHTNTFNWDAINAFLITLTAFNRAVQLPTGRNSLWEGLLTWETKHPLNNWGGLLAF